MTRSPGLSAVVVLTIALGAGVNAALRRLFFLALQFMATAAAMYIGLGTMPGAPIEDIEPLPAFATLITLTATLLFFLTEQHWEVLRALSPPIPPCPSPSPLPSSSAWPSSATRPPAPSSWRCRSARRSSSTR